MTPITKVQIPQEIQGDPLKFMKKEGEKLLITIGLATKTEISDTNFYALGNKGYNYAMCMKLLLNFDLSDGQKIGVARDFLQTVHNNRKYVEQYGLEIFLDLLKATLDNHSFYISGRSGAAFYEDLKSFDHIAAFDFLIKDKKTFLSTAANILKIDRVSNKTDLGRNAVTLIKYQKSLIERYGLEPFAQLITIGRLKPSHFNFNNVNGLEEVVDQVGFAPLIKIAQNLGADFSQFLKLFDFNGPHDLKVHEFSFSGLDFDIKKFISFALELAPFSRENTSEIIHQMSEYYSNYETMKFREIWPTFTQDYKKLYDSPPLWHKKFDEMRARIRPEFERTFKEFIKGEGSNAFFILSVYNYFHYLVDLKRFSEAELITLARSIAVRSEGKKKEVWQGLYALRPNGDSTFITSADDLTAKAWGLLQLAKSGIDESGMSMLGRFASSIKQYGMASFVEFVRYCSPNVAEIFDRSHLDPKWVEKYGISAFIDLAKTLRGETTKVLGQFRNAPGLLEQFGVDTFVEISKKHSMLSFGVLYDFRPWINTRADVFYAHEMVYQLHSTKFGRQAKPAVYQLDTRIITFLDIFAELNKGRNTTLKDVGEYFDKIIKERGDIVPLLSAYQKITYESLTKHYSVYRAAFEFERKISSIDVTSEQHLAKSFDLSELIKETSSAERFATSLRLLNNIDPNLAKDYASKIVLIPQWLRFDYPEIASTNLSDAVSSSTIVTLLSELFPKDKKIKEYKKYLSDQLAKVKVASIKPIKNLQDLEEAYQIADAFKETSPVIAGKYRTAIMQNIDFAQLVRDATGGKLDSKRLETARLKLNEINRILGDEFILFVGISMSKDMITKGNFFFKLDEVNHCCFSKPSSYQDVNNLYEMIGRFQANRLADYLVKNQKLFTEEERSDAVKKLDLMGVTVDFEESATTKASKQIKQGNIGYVITKTYLKLTAGGALRQEIIDLNVSPIRRNVQLRKGFDLISYVDGDRKLVATLITGKAENGAKISYEVKLGSGLNLDEVKDKYGLSLAALSVGAFTSGERKLADFAALNGSMINYLVSNRDGLIIFYPDGTADIKDVRNLHKNDIKTPGYQMESGPLEFRKKVDDFDIFIKKMKKAQASAMQGQLLLYNGELQLTDKSSGVTDKRRVFAILNDGSYALIDFNERITLMEAAVLAQKMGVKHLVNLDTGMYDFSQYIDKSGNVHKLGTFDSSNPTNLIIFHAGISAQVPQKLK
ncbi:hypothetical protein HY988_03305 [Candidatus Micrarchaeota archaeon]|nr:hypothetical protein [Candidatus Micrarchaeota archaeon]